MVHPFFDEIRLPNCRLPDSRHPGAPDKELPKLFNFSVHGKRSRTTLYQEWNECLLTQPPEMSIAPEKNDKLVPYHLRKELLASGIDLDNFVPLTREAMMARLD